MDNQKRILVVEDERDIAELVVHYLQREGYRASQAADGRTALSRAESELPDLLILDLMLPGMDGLEVCRRLRQSHRTADMPIIMLTAKTEESDKIVGLEMGADDYIAKPFSPKELVARVKSLFRRLDRNEEPTPAYKYGPLVLDRGRFEVTDDGREVSLTAKEFGLLEALLNGRGRVLTRDYLLNTVWGYDYYGSTRTVDVHIRHLREKIPLLAEAIVTIKNIGYKLRESP
ncbi:MAG: response regulator [candidate division Zixibacteria bacterium]|nr:response regulator [candidate division Zixibacteria bacterium]